MARAKKWQPDPEESSMESTTGVKGPMLHILASAAAAKMDRHGFPKDFPCPKALASLLAFQ
jgi:hypothetical protein